MWLGEKLQQLKRNLIFPKDRRNRILAEMLHRIDAEALLRMPEMARRTIQRPYNQPIYLFTKMPIFATLALIALLGGGTSAAAQNAMPGDLLYGVKIDVNEKVAGALNFTSETKVAFQAKLAGQRIDEAVKLASEGKLSDAWRTKLAENFKAHADAVERNLGELGGKNAIATAGLASDFEASLRTRHNVLKNVVGTSTLDIEIELEDVVKIKHDAENNIDREEATHASSTQTAASGKINAAENVVDAVSKFIAKISTSTATSTVLTDTQEQLGKAVDLLSQARVKFAAGDFSQAFTLAQEAIRQTQEIRISRDLHEKFNLKNIREEKDDDNELRNKGNEDGEDRENLSSSTNIATSSQDSERDGNEDGERNEGRND
jgi:hypothetical protein